MIVGLMTSGTPAFLPNGMYNTGWPINIIFKIRHMLQNVLANQFPNILGHAGWSGVAVVLYGAAVSCFSGVQLAQCWVIVSEGYFDRQNNQHVGLHRKPYNRIAYAAVGKWMGCVPISVAHFA
jgi:hypothetical protein